MRSAYEAWLRQGTGGGGGGGGGVSDVWVDRGAEFLYANREAVGNALYENREAVANAVYENRDLLWENREKIYDFGERVREASSHSSPHTQRESTYSLSNPFSSPSSSLPPIILPSLSPPSSSLSSYSSSPSSSYQPHTPTHSLPPPQYTLPHTADTYAQTQGVREVNGDEEGVEGEREDLICSLCAHLLTEPRQLVCGHSFCTLCLQDRMKVCVCVCLSVLCVCVCLCA